MGGGGGGGRGVSRQQETVLVTALTHEAYVLSNFSVNSLFGQSRPVSTICTFFCLVKNNITEVFQLSLVLECHTFVCIFSECILTF